MVQNEPHRPYAPRRPCGNRDDVVERKRLGQIYSVYRVDDREFVFDTEQAKKILQDVPLSAPEVAAFLEDYIKQGINSTNGGNEIL